jgi:hypothetical protein
MTALIRAIIARRFHITTTEGLMRKDMTPIEATLSTIVVIKMDGAVLRRLLVDLIK